MFELFIMFRACDIAKWASLSINIYPSLLYIEVACQGIPIYIHTERLFYVQKSNGNVGYNLSIFFFFFRNYFQSFVFSSLYTRVFIVRICLIKQRSRRQERKSTEENVCIWRNLITLEIVENISHFDFYPVLLFAISTRLLFQRKY
jgi:hypothetical protein